MTMFHSSLFSYFLLVLCCCCPANSFYTTASLQSRRHSQTSTTSLAVLSDYRSIRTLEDEAEDDDDSPRSLRSLTFTELLRKTGVEQQQQRRRLKAQTRFVAETNLPTELGLFRMRGYTMQPEHPVLEPCVIYAADKPPFGTNGTPASNVPIRIHDQCITSEVFGSLRCDCSDQLRMSLEYIQENGGCVIYLQQEGRGIGLANKIAAYALQDEGFDTVDANIHLGFAEDCREYHAIPSILQDMNIGSIQLMTNNPRKVDHLTKLGVCVESTIPMVVDDTTEHNHRYMETKVTRMHHDNLTALLTRSAVARAPLRNGMAPLASLSFPPIPVDERQEGVEAAADGYCFGRQSVEDAIEAMNRGEMVVVVDDMNRENEGDFIMAADKCTAADMARIVRYSSGVVCVALEEERINALELPPMVTNNQDPKGTAFTVSVDATAEHGITTGISAADRATTMRLLADPKSKATDFHRPGHVFPLRAREGGVLTRDGHTEAAVDLARLAGCSPVGVLCEIVSEDDPTEMMRLPEIKRFCKKHGHALTSIADMQQYRRDTGL